MFKDLVLITSQKVFKEERKECEFIAKLRIIRLATRK